MSKKQDSFYFQNFIDCADYSCKAAHLLKDTMSHFDVDHLPERQAQMHELEHAADMKKHELINMLVKSFITPIDREDILQVSQNLDNLTDKIEDVLIRLYYNCVRSIRPDALDMAGVVIRCCEDVQKMMNEFADFRHSKVLHEHIIRINTMEEEADRLYIDCMHRLHDTCTDPLEIIAWREIYTYLEKCADACEHVADVVESAVMKNT